MFKILVTSGNYKHSIAIQKYLKRSIPDIYLIVQDNSRLWFLCKLYRYADIIKRCSVEEALKARDFDMVIPVGGKDIFPTLRYAKDKTLLPSQESLEKCFDKWQTIQLAKEYGIPTPDSIYIKSIEEIDNIKHVIKFPLVIKPCSELDNKFVFYANDSNELNSYIKKAFVLLGENSKGIIVQEYIRGIGTGFFALYNKGIPLRIFMHQRLREWPISGGASTAAKAFFNSKLKDYGLKLLSALNWNGVAMLEFKYNPERDDFYLLEINAKFWGSLELALSAGVNFPADMVKAYRGEFLEYSEDYNLNQVFCWPFDNDLLNILKTRRLYLIKDYFRPNVKTNCGDSTLADILKMLIFLKRLIIK